MYSFTRLLSFRRSEFKNSSSRVTYVRICDSAGEEKSTEDTRKKTILIYIYFQIFLFFLPPFDGESLAG